MHQVGCCKSGDEACLACGLGKVRLKGRPRSLIRPRSRHTRLMEAFHFGCSLIVGMGPRGQLSKHPFPWNWRLRRLGGDLPSEVRWMCQGHPVQMEALLPLTGPVAEVLQACSAEDK